MEIKNAIIESATLDIGDRGFLQSWIFCDYGGVVQGFGGYVLYLPKSFHHHEIMSHAGHWIQRCMEISGVSEWSKMKGRSIRCHIENGLIKGIGHIIKDDWFFPSIDFKKSTDE